VKWSSRDELEAAVAAYQSDWWRTNQDALDVIDDRSAHPGLRARVSAISAVGQMVTTADIYRPSHAGAPDDRPYLPQRKEVHQSIVADCVARPPAHRHGGASSTKPSAFFTIGCPGAGKTSVLRTIVNRYRAHRAGPADRGPASIIDADRVRQLLPEYAYGRGSRVVDEECYYLTYGDVFDRALDTGADIIYDTIGRLTSIRDPLERLRSSGYDLHVLHATCPVNLCEQRTQQRALDVDGRLVPPGMLPRAASDAQEALAALRTERFPLAGWAVVDTTDMSASTLIEGTVPWTETF
jgi:adenylate kinase family enzyme